MITSSFNLTATERVLPRLALDFTTASLDSRVTFTRSGNAATVTNQSGSVVIANADTPRFDYLGGVCRGLLIEEQRTNSFTNSIFAGAVAGTPGTAPTNWLNLLTTGTIESVSAGIYAAGNAIRITTSGTRRAFYRVQALSANTTYAFSLTVTVNSTPDANFPRIIDCINLSAGPAGSSVTYQLNGVTVASSTVIPNGQTSTVAAIIAVGATAGNVEARCGLGVNSTVNGDVTIQMPQFETGAFATSYIPTTTTSLTRNADVVSMTGTNFSSWYNASEGTFMVQGIASVATSSGALSVDDGTSNERIQMRVLSGVAFSLVVDGGATQASIVTGTWPTGSSGKAVLAYEADNFVCAAGGAAPATDIAGTLPTVNRMQIGGATSGSQPYFNGHIQKVNYWPQRCIDNEVRAFSKG